MDLGKRILIQSRDYNQSRLLQWIGIACFLTASGVFVVSRRNQLVDSYSKMFISIVNAIAKKAKLVGDDNDPKESRTVSSTTLVASQEQTPMTTNSSNTAMQTPSPPQSQEPPKPHVVPGLGFDPYHSGERELQSIVGVRSQLKEFGAQFVRAQMPDQHREFFALLPYIIVSALDETGQPWVSILTGREGFAFSPEPSTLRINGSIDKGHPLYGRLQLPGTSVGILGLQNHTRRRNRVNGTVAQGSSEFIEVKVVHSFGNCPKYIQARKPQWTPSSKRATKCFAFDGTRSNQDVDLLIHHLATEIIQKADTFFIGSHSIEPRTKVDNGMDTSHRGGKPGFVKVDYVNDRLCLTVPDFTGNNFFNTLGNLRLDPRAGLAFVDFSTGTTVYLAVEGEIIWEGDELDHFEGALRLLSFKVLRGILVENELSDLTWENASERFYSANLQRTGEW
jgi:predicted pyridoxine 5'-phosphate oxidase superfamily flavin-nucleotide-binding protein